MLDITDNISGDEIVPPPDVMRYDDDDPYLVVAADKGTATFSDIANGLSAEYGFWMGDAFASGGSVGYDHKEMGITARGAWESVSRHFRELGHDTQTEDFTVVGIGDMSGDVFGNGMLLSRHIKLVGAFNHMHIFLDPDPDPEKSFEERERLFGLAAFLVDGLRRGPHLRGWRHLPAHGQVHPPLGAGAGDARRRGRIPDPDGAHQRDAQGRGRPALERRHRHLCQGELREQRRGRRQDERRLRVDGDELRCRVVGEGGNLGFTQTGRIEYALRGGRIYMDAIDNSAGVDCSDHEVNIKILLDAIVEAGDMTEKQRNELLASMTDEVGDLVLRDNYQQTQAINQALALAHPMVDVHARYIHSLEHEGRLDRELEFLPGDEELGERRSDNKGLTAPELAILLSYSKITTYQDLLDSDAPEDPYLSRELERYFPTPLRDRFREQIHEHRLHRQITATHVTNSLVNRCGPSFVFRLGEETGAEAPDIARAYMAAREIFSLRALWDDVEALDNAVEARIQTRIMLDARKLVERATRWLLRYRRTPLDIGATISHFSEGANELAESIPDILLDGDREAVENAAQRLIEASVPAGSRRARRDPRPDVPRARYNRRGQRQRGAPRHDGGGLLRPGRPAEAALAAPPHRGPAPRQPLAHPGALRAARRHLQPAGRPHRGGTPQHPARRTRQANA